MLESDPDVTHRYHITSSPIYMHRMCGVCLWSFSVEVSRTPGHCVDTEILKRDLSLCTYSLVLHLDIAAYLLQCCGSFGMDHVNLCTVIKQGLKMHFLHWAALRIPGSLLFVVCGHMCFSVYVGCPKGVSFADVKGMIYNFFFLISLLINSLVEGSVPNVAMLAAATGKRLNTTGSWIILRILGIVSAKEWITCSQISVGRNVREQDQKPTQLMGIMPCCTWKCEGR